MKKILTFTFLITLAACSTKQLYQAGQGYQKSECIKESDSESQYNDCVNADKKSFEEYEKERKAHAKNKIK